MEQASSSNEPKNVEKIDGLFSYLIGEKSRTFNGAKVTFTDFITPYTNTRSNLGTKHRIATYNNLIETINYCKSLAAKGEIEKAQFYLLSYLQGIIIFTYNSNQGPKGTRFKTTLLDKTVSTEVGIGKGNRLFRHILAGLLVGLEQNKLVTTKWRIKKANISKAAFDILDTLKSMIISPNDRLSIKGDISNPEELNSVIINQNDSLTKLVRAANKLAKDNISILDELSPAAISTNDRFAKLVKIAIGFMRLPLNKEHEFGSHQEKIDGEYKVLNRIVNISSEDDLVGFIEDVFKKWIPISRDQGSDQRSSDFENQLYLVVDKIINLYIHPIESEDEAPTLDLSLSAKQQILDMFLKYPEVKTSSQALLLVLDIYKEDEKNGILNTFNILEKIFSGPQIVNRQPVDRGLYFYQLCKGVISPVRAINYLLENEDTHLSPEQLEKLHSFGQQWNLTMYAFNKEKISWFEPNSRYFIEPSLIKTKFPVKQEIDETITQWIQKLFLSKVGAEKSKQKGGNNYQQMMNKLITSDQKQQDEPENKEDEDGFSTSKIKEGAVEQNLNWQNKEYQSEEADISKDPSAFDIQHGRGYKGRNKMANIDWTNSSPADSNPKK